MNKTSKGSQIWDCLVLSETRGPQLRRSFLEFRDRGFPEIRHLDCEFPCVYCYTMLYPVLGTAVSCFRSSNILHHLAREPAAAW